MAAKINTDECVGCGVCVDSCPNEAIEVVDGVAVVNEAECVDCGTCVDECAVEAISIE
jgi:ferredoxin